MPRSGQKKKKDLAPIFHSKLAGQPFVLRQSTPEPMAPIPFFFFFFFFFGFSFCLLRVPGPGVNRRDSS